MGTSVLRTIGTEAVLILDRQMCADTNTRPPFITLQALHICQISGHALHENLCTEELLDNQHFLGLSNSLI
jgi:hypothetical protein